MSSTKLLKARDEAEACFRTRQLPPLSLYLYIQSNQITTMVRSRRVAVIGAGVAGLVAARELQREGHEVTVFEKSNRVGGIWVYDPRTESDPLGQDPNRSVVHSSLYASMRTNLPRELMSFTDRGLAGRVFNGDPRAFPGHEEVLAFIEAFAKEEGVVELVRFAAEVIKVEPTGQREEWRVTWRNESGDVEKEDFQAVVVCNGHLSEPKVPEIPGIHTWPGKQTHCHNFRTPEPFKDQVVVIVGMGASAIDIFKEISYVAKEVHLASPYEDGRIGGKLAGYGNTWLHSKITSVQDDGQVFFKEGSALVANVILYCTGYNFSFPFLDLDEITVDDNRVGPLYKHIFPPKFAPQLSFIGVTNKSILLATELQSKFVAQVLSDKLALPSEEDMMSSVNEYYRHMEEAGLPKRYTHSLSANQDSYLNWLAAEVGLSAIKPWMFEMYRKTVECIVSLDAGYRDKWDGEMSRL